MENLSTLELLIPARAAGQRGVSFYKILKFYRKAIEGRDRDCEFGFDFMNTTQTQIEQLEKDGRVFSERRSIIFGERIFYRNYWYRKPEN